MDPDHYRLLGVAASAGADEIRAAYLRLMRACHPDVRPGDLAAAETARRANLAWKVLRDPQARAAYDRQLRAAAPPSAADAPVEAPLSPGQAAYAQRRKAYGQAFHRACLKVGVAVFASGLLLLAFTAR